MDFSMQMWKDIPSTVAGHVKAGNVNWPMTIYIALVHVVAIIGAFQIPNCSKETLLFSVILWPITYVKLQCIVEFTSSLHHFNSDSHMLLS
jgi:hypothetical protein